ncbi:triose phosphate isomerase [Mycena filopes]|nr:triose phosphate isomerase [Mycena filopes]
MSPSPRKWFVCGYWDAKTVNSLSAALDLAGSLKRSALSKGIEIALVPPSIHLTQVKAELANGHYLAGTTVGVGAQNTFITEDPVYKGDMSVTQLVENGFKYVILGRVDPEATFSETGLIAAYKAQAAIAAGLTVIYCVGETLEQRDAGEVLSVVSEQVQAVIDKLDEAAWSKMIIAYEPTWAIGAAKPASEKYLQPVHTHIRGYVATHVSPAVAAATRIIYGGGVTSNYIGNLACREDVDGFLVSGTRLKEFREICNSQPNTPQVKSTVVVRGPLYHPK